MRKLLVFVLFFTPCFTAFSQVTCEDSLINCIGECGQFDDYDNDGFCDHGLIDSSVFKKKKPLVTPDSSAATKPKAAAVKPLPKKEKALNAQQHDSSKKAEAPNFFTPVNDSTLKVGSSSRAEVQEAPPSPQVQRRKKERTTYHFFSVAIPLTLLYIGLNIAVNRKRLKKASFLRIWDLLLLITFAVSALLGLLIALKINYQLHLPYLKPIYLVHVDFGIAMTVICFFHVVKNWSFYVRMFKAHKASAA